MSNVNQLAEDYITIMEKCRKESDSRAIKLSNLRKRWEHKGYQIPTDVEAFLDLFDKVLDRVNEIQKGAN